MLETILTVKPLDLVKRGSVIATSVCQLSPVVLPTPDPITVSVVLTCTLNVMVDVQLTVTPLAPIVGGVAGDVTVGVMATQNALPIALSATIIETSFEVSFTNGAPTSITHTEVFTPPLPIDLMSNNVVDSGEETVAVTPTAGTLSFALASEVNLSVGISGGATEVSCAVPAGMTADFLIN